MNIRKSKENMEGKERSLEKKVKKRSRRGAVERLLLGILVTGGLMTVAMAAPKVLNLLKREHLDVVLPPDPRQRLYETVGRMARKGWVRFETKNGRKQMRITEKGRDVVSRVDIGTYSIPKPLRWDEKWRIVIFDIPEKRRGDRLRIRNLLTQLGFFCLQKSVWVHPYDCEEVVSLIKAQYRLGSSVLYLIADAIEFERPIREHFGLPQER